MTELLPLWLKLAYTLYTGITVIIYWFKYGPGNYLWFSDLALILTVPALWLESPQLASMMLLAILLPELVWNISFFTGLLSGKPLGSLAAYMFEADKPLYLRGLSLFHVFLPVLLLYMVARLGYDEDALLWQSLLAWIVLPLSYLLTDPAENINWVHGPGDKPQHLIPALVYLGLLMLIFPMLIYLPTHLLLGWLFV
ncbi:MAG: membrane-associated protein [Zetaproteobacteria bacterium CG12_big_fil_rev_8_21_14_0_65_55_1124]|nr:MAG: membrane-associated protein [Zetaproteobacteria bacterium CG1_02_55_237]PIS18749.1 MAG: membrane-associated protein [Zetaproteobacteria bacterium CG08_land_8_20_14_0_20_55_17]PIW43981.1 MAG: membrane-associated protein [Zetaproteobacteria bacterium CG12_big_fil_rev_8_21_14_0_65_55_1124]PIY52476.1 MAG: membrane-associated protein [Zetaproteobacteria bacterium CG_4_10_14_0_8_um_filter_55_43]PIZ36755.1 MAG: membrane-associated protein [Zetaproteobacteria bacterium CG_4_10_14_0_2_um_filter_